MTCFRLILSLAALLLAQAAQAQGLPFLHTGDTVLFQGDSITDGGRLRNGNDLNHTMGQDYAYLLAAEIGAASPEEKLLFINRGVSGERAVDLAARWQQDTLALHPALLSILVGINDLLGEGDRAQTVSQYQATYDGLLRQTLAVLPDAKIVLGEPFMLPVGKYKSDYAARRIEVKQRQAVVARLATKYHLPIVHYQAAFDAACAKAPPDYWIWDGIHPTYAGHGIMAKEWLRIVNERWPAP
jgi:lysophospholipase L1-like esterase